MAGVYEAPATVAGIEVAVRSTVPWAARWRSLRWQLRRLWREPHRLLVLLGAESHPYVCAACGRALGDEAAVVWSERFDGPVNADCERIPAWIRHEPHALRLLWLRAGGEAPAGRRPARFCLDSALRGL